MTSGLLVFPSEAPRAASRMDKLSKIKITTIYTLVHYPESHQLLMVSLT